MFFKARRGAPRVEHMDVDQEPPVPVDPRVPHPDSWLPAGVVARVDHDEVERGWVIARRIHGDQEEQAFAYKLFLPTWRPFIGGGAQGTLVPVSEDSFHPGEGGGASISPRPCWISNGI